MSNDTKPTVRAIITITLDGVTDPSGSAADAAVESLTTDLKHALHGHDWALVEVATDGVPADRAHPTTCPNCGATPESGPFAYDSGEFGDCCYQRVTCAACGAEWSECYKPNGIIIIYEGDKPAQETPA